MLRTEPPKPYKYKGFTHTECEFYPCHKISEDEELNCMFCYCPLNYLKDCGGNYTILASGAKDCSQCLLPHRSYDYIIARLKKEAHKSEAHKSEAHKSEAHKSEAQSNSQLLGSSETHSV